MDLKNEFKDSILSINQSITFKDSNISTEKYVNKNKILLINKC